MSENGIATTLPDTGPLYRLIRRTRALLRSSWIATGLGLTLGLGLGSLVAVSLTDLVVPLLPALRLLGLVLVVVPAGWAFFVGVVRPLFRRLGPGHVARRIEKHIPGIHNRLVSCIDLASTGGEGKVSPAFYRRLLTEALERIRGFRASTVVDFFSLRRAVVFALAAVGAFVLALILFSDRLPTAMARIFQPFADIPPASDVVFTVVPGPDAKVLRGEDIVFGVQVEKGEPREFQLELFSDQADKPVWHPLRKGDNRQWQIALNSSNIGAGFEHTFHYRIHGGGTWSKKYEVAVIDRPAITDLHTVLHYPEYMGIPEPRANPPQAADVTGPEDSRVEVVVRAEGDVKDGAIQFLETRKRPVAVADQKERVWFEDKVPAGAMPEGTWQWEARKQQRPSHTEPAFAGVHGHWFQGSAVGFQVEPGDNLFTYVHIDSANPPEAIMLEWHDGTNWDHRAFWGVDKFDRLGKPETPSRWRMGPLPAVGQWVRLEVPADFVGLQGKTLRGMSFKLSGGQCSWHRAGTVRVEEEALVPMSTFAMHGGEGNQWSGQFPLRGSGLYRVELRNELGYANKSMKEAKFIAIPDYPPQIVLERPGTDVTLSEAGKVPLVLAAYDDFGLAEIRLSLQRDDNGPWENRVLKTYATPRQSETLVTSLDLKALKMKVGEFVRYHAEAKDRKGQTARTQDYLVRIVAADPNAADRQLAVLEKNEDNFKRKLLTLIAQQAKVRDNVEKLAVKFAPLEDKIEAAEARVKAEEAAQETKPPAPNPRGAPQPNPLKLDPETLKALEELKKEMGQLARQEQQNTQLGKEIDSDLSKIVEQATKLQVMPKEMADQLQALQNLFQQRALDPLQDLSKRMSQAADPRKQNDPDLKNLKQDSDRVQKDLESLRERMQALDEAQKNMRDDIKEAIAKMEKDLLQQQGGLTARDLEDLKKFIKALRDELDRDRSNQENLKDAAAKAEDAKLAEMEKKQAMLDKDIDKDLDKTRDLQASEKMKRMKKRPDFPKSPYDPDAGEEKVRPKEEDPDEALDASKKETKGDKTPAKDKKDKSEDDEDEDKFMPALGGPKPKLDPRYANKRRPLTKGAPKGQKTPQEQRDELQAHQEEKLSDVNRADKSLEADEKSVEEMLQELRQMLNSNNSPSDQSGPKEGAQEGTNDLAQMLESQAFQQALSMAARMRGMRQGRTPSQARKAGANPNLQGSPPPGSALEGELGKLDPRTRAAFLKLQPKLREELLQSRTEKGPEGYQEFIDDYFKRLSQSKNPK